MWDSLFAAFGALPAFFSNAAVIGSILPSWLLNAVGSCLAFFYAIVPNYGVGIVLVTVVIRLILYPLTAKQARSMGEMQRVQPEIKRLQQKYKNDRQKLNEELMAFYKEHGINPLAGCLPMVAQIPIFIGLYEVLRHPVSHVPVGSSLFNAFCPGAATAAACKSPKGLTFLGMDLSVAPNSAHGGLLSAAPFWILVGLVVLSGYWQSKQMTRLQKGRATAQSQMMTRIFPVFFGFISITLPAGVVLYFLISNVWQIGQQAIVFGGDDDTTKARSKRGSSESSDGKGRKGSKGSKGGDGDGASPAEQEPSGGSGKQSNGGGAKQRSGGGRNRSSSNKKKKRKRRR